MEHEALPQAERFGWAVERSREPLLALQSTTTSPEGLQAHPTQEWPGQGPRV